jgi:hypothetical protein
MMTATDVTPSRDPVTDLADRIVDCLVRGDRETLVALYHPRALLDANVPRWRFQLTGRAAIGEALATELEVPGRRVAGLRRTGLVGGVLVENEIRFPGGDGEELWRNAHVFRFDGAAIVEHTVWCTGIWDPGTIARQVAEAPMVRP